MQKNDTWPYWAVLLTENVRAHLLTKCQYGRRATSFKLTRVQRIFKRRSPDFQRFFFSQGFEISSGCFWLSVAQTITIKLRRISDWKEILVRRKQTQSRFPEEMNSCHLVIPRFHFVSILWTQCLYPSNISRIESILDICHVAEIQMKKFEISPLKEKTLHSICLFGRCSINCVF